MEVSMTERVEGEAGEFATEAEAIAFYEAQGMTTSDAQAAVEALQLMRERGLTV